MGLDHQPLKKSKIPLWFSGYLLFVFLLSFFRIFFYQSPKLPETNKITLTVESLQISGDRMVLEGNNTSLIYYKKKEFPKIELGDQIEATGTYQYPKRNTNFYLFDYQKYLLSKHIVYEFSADKIVRVQKYTSFFYHIKNKILERIESLKSRAYVKTFLLGDMKEISKKVRDVYQKQGLSHLFSVSGMHITFFAAFFLSTILKKRKYSTLILSVFFLFYVFLVQFTPSAMRSIVFFLMLRVKKRFCLPGSTISLFFLLLSFFLLYNPFYLYHLGFQFSFLISFFLLVFSSKINACKSYFGKTMMTSLIAFFASIPLVIQTSFEVSVLTIVYNLFFVPIITYLLFPFSFLVFFFPFLDSFYFFFITFI